MCKEPPAVLNYADAKKSNLFIIKKQYEHVIQHRTDYLENEANLCL